MGTIGIIANPASGKDVRRLVARASVFDNQEKRAIVRRALMGIAAAGNVEVAYLDDPHGIVRLALEDAGKTLRGQPVTATRTGSVMDTVSAARALKALECSLVITLGGDGTNRAVALGWQDLPVLPISTGTNNVFPIFVEATIAGATAGLIASGRVALREVAQQHKLIRVHIDGEKDDLALIDAVLTRERFVGSRALLSPEQLTLALLTRADPAAVGMTAIGGLLQPLEAAVDAGLLVELGEGGEILHAPIAPGYYRDVSVTARRTVPFGETVVVEGPGVLAFDGERERTLKPGQKAQLCIERSGPWVVDVERTMRLAAEKGCFRR
jgi:hypothetical protein